MQKNGLSPVFCSKNIKFLPFFVKTEDENPLFAHNFEF